MEFFASSIRGHRIALFGTSANPPTGLGGHVGIVRHLVKTGRFDEIWVMPVYQHMFAAKRSLEAFEHRVKLCKLCTEEESVPTNCIVRVVEIERLAAGYYLTKGVKRVGTIDIINFINDHKPGLELHLILGTDTYNDLMSMKWKNAARILELVSVHMIARKGYEPTTPTTSIKTTATTTSEGSSIKTTLTTSGKDHNIHEIKLLSEVSSSKIREMFVAYYSAKAAQKQQLQSATAGAGTLVTTNLNTSQGTTKEENSLRNILHPAVFDYIIENSLYDGLSRKSAPDCNVDDDPSTRVPTGSNTCTSATATNKLIVGTGMPDSGDESLLPMNTCDNDGFNRVISQGGRANSIQIVILALGFIYTAVCAFQHNTS